ncbi:MAG: hypothetical protein RLZZ511_3067 [Cyanobacteriota bacterium]|jgi:glycosyltransferase involved in cell wall biosynthesis
MQINYFSPLLPAQSGISEVAEQVIPALARHANITIWTEQSTWSAMLERYAQVKTYNPKQIPWDAIAKADTHIYHLGNNVEYHHHIWRISQQLPGIVVLHDVQLHHLFCGITCGIEQNPESYIQQIIQCYGIEASLTARRFLSGELPISAVEHYGMTEWALKNATGVIVHTRTALQELAMTNRWPIGYQPLPFQAPPQLAPPHRTAAPPYRLIIFGYIGHNRRVASVLSALGNLPNRSDFRLDIYGKLSDDAPILEQIEVLNLETQVTVHGFVEDTVLDQALGQADLAINLRYPTMGEASISQLRIWQHALPALVTQVGWYAEQPNDTVCFVRPDHEIADIQHYLQAFAADPAQFRAIGAKGRQRLETDHSPAAYAQAIVDFARTVQTQQHHLSTQYWLERSAAILSPWQAGVSHPQSTDRVAAAISWLSGSPVTE